MPRSAGEEGKGEWEWNRARLRRDVLSRDARGFLTWEVIRDTMFPPPYAAFARTELRFLKRQGGGRWKSVLRERGAGLPMPCVFYPRSSSNAIHHAYHLCRFEVETGLKVRDFGSIAEFGGGYGSLCRIVHGLGFRGRYVICDLPEQSALQRYYLDAVGIEKVATVSEIAALGEELPGERLFVATWSLSETPVDLRRQVAEAVQDFDAFLIAYQSDFDGVENAAFFKEWQGWFPAVRWKSCAIKHVLASAYLFGVRVLHTGA